MFSQLVTELFPRQLVEAEVKPSEMTEAEVEPILQFLVLDEKLLEATSVQNWVVYLDREDMANEVVVLESLTHIGTEDAVAIAERRASEKTAPRIILNQLS